MYSNCTAVLVNDDEDTMLYENLDKIKIRSDVFVFFS